MKYLLIDTCSWINLITTEQENPQIEKLNYWIQEGLIQIIIHEVIIKEWNEKKEGEKRRIYQHWETIQKHFKKFLKTTGNIALSHYSTKLDFIDKQFDVIDNIIKTSPVQIKTSEAVKAIIPDKSIDPKKAPFHYKDDSTKDAYLYFSTVEFCKSNGISELFFFSDNTSDFGKPLTSSTKKEPKGAKNIIHPDLLIDFPEVSVCYFGDIGWGIHELSEELPLVTSTDTFSPDKGETYNVLNIDKNKPVLDQIHDYILKAHNEISFVPLHIFINHYPFKNSPKSYPHYSLFSLSTESNELSELFESIEFTDNEDIKILNDKFYTDVTDYKRKMKKVLTSLTQNLIFYISNKKSRKTTTIRYSDKKNCNCPKCSFNKFKFIDALNSLDSYSDSIEDLKELSYIHYHIGNFVEASKNLKLVYQLAVDSKLYTTAFIAKYNLSKLYVFIKNNYWGEQAQDSLLEELKNIDLSSYSTKFETNENKKLIAWIIDNKFYSDSKDRIQSIVSKVIDHYYRCLNGGGGTNSEILQLINKYAEIEAFLNNNYIIYDGFKEFSDLSNVFFEGLFASHAIEASQNSRLELFDDWLITQLLVYGDADNLNKLFNRYKLKSLKYKATSTNGDSFNDLIDSFFSSNPLLKENFLNVNEKENKTFWHYYNRIFINILTIVPICDFDKEFFNQFTVKLLTYLESDKYIRFNNFKYVRLFLQRIGKKLDTKILLRFFLLMINNSNYHKDDFFEILSEILNDRHEKLKITQSQFETIKNLAFEECKICKEKHSNTLIIYIYKLIENEEYKKEICHTISKILQDSFSFHLFYLATLFEIIDFKEELFIKALEYAYPKDKQVSIESFFFWKKDIRYDSFNDIVNLCFKYNINTNETNFKKFKELDVYYCWLLDMDGFDYKKFQPSWIGEYPTRYYYKKICTTEKVKQALDIFLKDNFDSKIERDYFNIFIRKAWQIQKEE